MALRPHDKLQRLPLTEEQSKALSDAELAAMVAALPTMASLDVSHTRNVSALTMAAIAHHHDHARLRSLDLDNTPMLNALGAPDFTLCLEPSTFPELRYLSLSSMTEIDQKPVPISRDDSTTTHYVQVPITTAQWTRIFRACPNLEVLYVRGRVLVHSIFFDSTDQALVDGLIPRPYPFDGANYPVDLCELIVTHLPRLKVLDMCHAIGSFITPILDHKTLQRLCLPDFDPTKWEAAPAGAGSSSSSEPAATASSGDWSLRQLIDGVPLGYCQLDQIEDDLYERSHCAEPTLPPLRAVDVGMSNESLRRGVLQTILHHFKTIDTIILRDDKVDFGGNLHEKIGEEWATLQRYRPRSGGETRLQVESAAAAAKRAADIAEEAAAAAAAAAAANPNSVTRALADSLKMKAIGRKEEYDVAVFYTRRWSNIRCLELRNVRSPSTADKIARLVAKFSRTLEQVTIYSSGQFINSALAKSLSRCTRLKLMLLSGTAPQGNDEAEVDEVFRSLKTRGVTVDITQGRHNNPAVRRFIESLRR